MKPEQIVEYVAGSDLRFRVLEALVEAPLTEKELTKKFKNAKYKDVLRGLEEYNLVIEVVRVETKTRHKTNYVYKYDKHGNYTQNYDVKVSKVKNTKADHCFGLTEDGHRIYAEVDNMRKQANNLWSGYKK